MDWKLVIEELERTGLTQNEIAAQAGCSQPYVSQLKSGKRKNPDYHVGTALESLHRIKCPPLRDGEHRSAA